MKALICTALLLVASPVFAQTARQNIARAAVNVCVNNVCTDAFVEQVTDAGGTSTFLWYFVYNELSWVIYAHEPGRYIANTAFIAARDAGSASVSVSDVHLSFAAFGSDYLNDARSVTQSVGGVVTKFSDKGLERPQSVTGDIAGWPVNAEGRVVIRTWQGR